MDGLKNTLEREFLENLSVEIKNESESWSLVGDYQTVYSENSRFGGLQDSAEVFVYSSSTIVESGQNYKLSFEYEGKKVEAETLVPYPAEIVSISQTQIEEVDLEYTYTVDAVRFRLKDPANERNAYLAKMFFNVWQYERDYDRDRMEFVVVDSMLISQNLVSEVVLDEGLNGLEISIDIPVYPFRIFRFSQKPGSKGI